MENLSVIIMVIGAIQLIMVICFFNLVLDVGNINRLLKAMVMNIEVNKLTHLYHLAHVFGDREEIIRIGKLLIFEDLKRINSKFKSQEDRFIQYKGLMQSKWQKMVDEYQIPLPDFKVMASL